MTLYKNFKKIQKYDELRLRGGNNERLEIFK